MVISDFALFLGFIVGNIFYDIYTHNFFIFHVIMNRGIYSSGLMSQGEAIEEAKRKRINRLESENKENEKFKHILEIKREIRSMKNEMDIIKRDMKIILSFIQEIKEMKPEENKGWFFG